MLENNYFLTFKKISTRAKQMPFLSFILKTCQKKYDQYGVTLDSLTESVLIGDESIQSYKSVINSLESMVN